MAKSYKLKDENYIDSTSVSHEKVQLNEVLNSLSTGKVDKATTIAGIDLQDNITVTELVNALKVEMLKIENPVGTIRMQTTNTNPSTFLGFGTWSLWGSGRVPVGVNTSDTSFNTVEKTGGSKTANISHSHTIASHNHGGNTGSHTLTINEMPKHTHNMPSRYALEPGGGSQEFGGGSATSKLVTMDSAGGGAGHSHTITASGQQTTSTVGSTALSLLQPYITCYMWKRTA